jgi:DNA-binding transcriptional MerR regulator
VAEPTSETTKRALLKAPDVCDLAKVQPYVLRSWEKEFPDLGVTRSAGGPRFYRRADVERVLRIKQLVFSEGLTLSGARRRLEEERAGQPDDDLPFEDVVVVPPAGLPNARARIDEVKQGLRAILQLLGRQIAQSAGGSGNGHSVTPEAAPAEEPLLPMDEAPAPIVTATRAKKAGRSKRAAR